MPPRKPTKPKPAPGPTPSEEIRRIADAALRAAMNPALGTVIGQMFVFGTITRRQFAGAESYGRLRGRHDVIIGLPRRHERAAWLDDDGGGSWAEPDEDVILEVRREHADAWNAAGPDRALLDRVCLDQHPPAPTSSPGYGEPSTGWRITSGLRGRERGVCEEAGAS